jgi:hypothetical protein
VDLASMPSSKRAGEGKHRRRKQTVGLPEGGVSGASTVSFTHGDPSL